MADELRNFTVKLQHETQHPVRRRMLRAEIDGEVAQVVDHFQLGFFSAFSSPGSA